MLPNEVHTQTPVRHCPPSRSRARRVLAAGSSLCAGMLAFVAFGCASPGPATLGGLKSYRVGGKTYVPLRDWEGFAETGVASWYGEPHHGRRTASGEVFDTRGGFTAAHKTLPFNVCARVQNLSTGESVVVRINDRGPFVKGRVIDLSRAAARRISLARAGVAKVRIQALSVADRKGGCA